MEKHNSHQPILISFLSVLILSATVFANPTITAIGKYDIANVPSDQEGLSGITWAGGNTFYAAEDSGGRLHKLTINIDLSSGSITGSPNDDSQVTLNGRTDIEGVAYAGSNQVYVSDETGATITKYNVSGGSATGSIAVPDIYTAYRTNKSLESLTRQSNGSSIWTANEEALNGTTTGGTSVDDGPEADVTHRTVVRLQKFNSSLNPAGQWAYQTEKVQALKGNRGVSDLCVLPDGQLLVLEREAYWNGGLWGDTIDYRSAIYLVDFSGATDVSNITSLNGASYTPVSKSLLWSANFDNYMFEGLCLGPQLNDGSYELLMISDGDTFDPPLGSTQNPGEAIYALKISGVVPEPVSILLILSGVLLLLNSGKKKRFI